MEIKEVIGEMGKIKEIIGKIGKPFWYLDTEPCAYCGDDRTSIELTIRASGQVIVRKWFCTYRHLAAWWREEYRGESMPRIVP